MDHVDPPTDPAPPTDEPTGARGEHLAERYLTARGYTIVARNWRLAVGELRGELDLVCRDGGQLVFVEVKTRRGEGFGGPLAAVTHRKQRKLRALAAAFLRESGLRSREVRFDVVGIRLEAGGGASVDHRPAAF